MYNCTIIALDVTLYSRWYGFQMGVNLGQKANLSSTGIHIGVAGSDVRAANCPGRIILVKFQE